MKVYRCLRPCYFGDPKHGLKHTYYTPTGGERGSGIYLFADEVEVCHHFEPAEMPAPVPPAIDEPIAQWKERTPTGKQAARPRKTKIKE